MSANLRVGLLIYGSLETISGGYLYDRQLVEHIQRQGDVVQVISLPWRSYLRHLGDNRSSVLLQQLVELKVDVLLQDELNHPSLAWLNSRLKRRVAYPLVSIVHHLRSSELRPAWQNTIYRLVEHRYLNSVDAFVYNSRTTQRVVHSLLRQTTPEVIAYPAGDRLKPQINSVEIQARCVGEEPLRLLFLANLIPRKGLHILLQACSQLPEGSWSLDVVGRQDVDPAYSLRIRQQVQLLGMGAKVQFHGNPGDAALAKIMAKSHILAVPSSYEGFGIVYLEGMGFGLPAIATTAGAAGETITDGLDGFLVPPEDPVALARVLVALAEDRGKLVALSLEARKRYLRHPTWEQSASLIRSFLVEICSKVNVVA